MTFAVDGQGQTSRLDLSIAVADQLATTGARLALSISFLEVYNEHISDLLLPAGGRAAWGGGGSGSADGGGGLSLREDHSGEVHVSGLTEVPVHQV